jgi:hypothetical protein
MVGIAQIEARNALFPELVGAEAKPRRLFAELAPESNARVPSFLHPMRYAASGPGPSPKSAPAAVDYALAADGERAYFGRQKFVEGSTNGNR